MKRICAVLFVFWIAACTAIASPDVTEDHSSAALEITRAVATGGLPSPSMRPTRTVLPPAKSTSSIRQIFPPTLMIPTLQAGSPVELVSTIPPSLKMMDGQVGWAVQRKYPSELRPGYQLEVSYPWQPEGYILRTTDGGRTWQNVTPSAGAYPAGGFFALDANYAWASENVPCCTDITATRVWRTTDGGKTWQLGQPFTIDSDGVQFFMPRILQFMAPNTGWLLATVKQDGLTSDAFPTFDHNFLFRTTDGGDTWEKINSTSEDLGAGIGWVRFINSSTGWYGLHGGERHTFREYFSEGGWKILHTSDGGDSFFFDTMIPTPSELQKLESTDPFMDCAEYDVMAFTVEVVGIQWGCEVGEYAYSVGPWYRYFSLSSDAGNTWNTWKAESSEYFLNGTHGWRVISPDSPDQLGQLQQTMDGANWVTIKRVAWEYAGFDFISEQEGWAIVSRSSHNALVHTTDGGKTWEEIEPVIAAQ